MSIARDRKKKVVTGPGAHGADRWHETFACQQAVIVNS